MNIKNYIKKKWNERKKKYYKLLMLRSILFFLSFSSLNTIIFSTIGLLNVEDKIFAINMWIMMELVTLSETLLLVFIEMIINYFSNKKEDYNELILNGDIKKKTFNSFISKKEESDIKEFCLNSSLDNEEIEIIRRYILSEEKNKSKEINTEYLMLKFLIEIEKHEKLKKEFDDQVEKVKNQMKLLNKTREKLKDC